MKPPTPTLKLVDCGACSRPIRAENIHRRIRYGVRDVPLCAVCGTRSDAWVGERLGYGAGDAERKG